MWVWILVSSWFDFTQGKIISKFYGRIPFIQNRERTFKVIILFLVSILIYVSLEYFSFLCFTNYIFCVIMIYEYTQYIWKLLIFFIWFLRFLSDYKNSSKAGINQSRGTKVTHIKPVTQSYKHSPIDFYHLQLVPQFNCKKHIRTILIEFILFLNQKYDISYGKILPPQCRCLNHSAYFIAKNWWKIYKSIFGRKYHLIYYGSSLNHNTICTEDWRASATINYFRWAKTKASFLFFRGSNTVLAWINRSRLQEQTPRKPVKNRWPRVEIRSE